MLCMTRNLINCDMYHVVDVEIIDVEKTIPLRKTIFFDFRDNNTNERNFKIQQNTIKQYISVI